MNKKRPKVQDDGPYQAKRAHSIFASILAFLAKVSPLHSNFNNFIKSIQTLDSSVTTLLSQNEAPATEMSQYQSTWQQLRTDIIATISNLNKIHPNSIAFDQLSRMHQIILNFEKFPPATPTAQQEFYICSDKIRQNVAGVEHDIENNKRVSAKNKLKHLNLDLGSEYKAFLKYSQVTPCDKSKMEKELRSCIAKLIEALNHDNPSQEINIPTCFQELTLFFNQFSRTGNTSNVQNLFGTTNMPSVVKRSRTPEPITKIARPTPQVIPTPVKTNQLSKTRSRTPPPKSQLPSTKKNTNKPKLRSVADDASSTKSTPPQRTANKYSPRVTPISSARKTKTTGARNLSKTTQVVSSPSTKQSPKSVTQRSTTKIVEAMKTPPRPPNNRIVSTKKVAKPSNDVTSLNASDAELLRAVKKSQVSKSPVLAKLSHDLNRIDSSEKYERFEDEVVTKPKNSIIASIESQIKMYEPIMGGNSNYQQFVLKLDTCANTDELIPLFNDLMQDISNEYNKILAQTQELVQSEQLTNKMKNLLNPKIDTFFSSEIQELQVQIDEITSSFDQRTDEPVDSTKEQRNIIKQLSEIAAKNRTTFEIVSSSNDTEEKKDNSELELLYQQKTDLIEQLKSLCDLI